METNLFTRDSTFSYEMKNGKKVYSKKVAELKIEKFASTNQMDEGKRIGYVSLNLEEFIGKGLKYLTFKMDKEGLAVTHLELK